MLGAAIFRAKGDEFGRLRAVQRHAGAGDNPQCTHDLGIVGVNVACADLDRALHGSLAHDDGGQKTGKLGEFHRARIAAWKRFAQRRERAFEWKFQVLCRIRDGAQFVDARIADRQCDDLLCIKADFQRPRARMRQEQQRAPSPQFRQTCNRRGLDRQHLKARIAFHQNRLPAA